MQKQMKNQALSHSVLFPKELLAISFELPVALVIMSQSSFLMFAL
jgi:hypothetical protein